MRLQHVRMTHDSTVVWSLLSREPLRILTQALYCQKPESLSYMTVAIVLVLLYLLLRNCFRKPRKRCSRWALTRDPALRPHPPLSGSTNISETMTYHQNSNGEPMAFCHGKLAIPTMTTDNRKWRPNLYSINPVSTDILTFTVNEPSADILLAWSIYFVMFEKSNATFYGNPLCAVDNGIFILLLAVLSIILKMYSYRCLYGTPRRHFQSPTFKNI